MTAKPKARKAPMAIASIGKPGIIGVVVVVVGGVHGGVDVKACTLTVSFTLNDELPMSVNLMVTLIR